MKMHTTILCTKETIRDTETADVQVRQVPEQTMTTKLMSQKIFSWILNFKNLF